MTEIDRGSRVVVFLLGAYIVLVPSISLVPSMGPYNEKRALQIGLMLAMGGILLASSTSRRQWLSIFGEIPALARWGLGMVLGLGGLSSALAPAPFSAFLELSHFVLLFVAAGVVASAVRQAPKQTERLLLGAVALSALLYAVYFTVRYSGALVFPALEIGREIVSGFANIRFFNQYQTWTLPLLGGVILALPNQWRVGQGGILFLAALWWALIFASNVRGTVVAMTVAAVGVWLLFGRNAHRWLGVQVTALLVGGVLYYILFTLGGGVAPQVLERLGDVGGKSRRLLSWAKSLDMARGHLWLGVGPLHYAWPPYDFTAPAHPHNAFLQWMAEWGLPSTVLMSGLTIWGGWRWLQQERDGADMNNPSSNAVSVALVASVIAGTVHAMVSGLLVMPLSQVLLILVGGWAWGRYRQQRYDSSVASSTWPHAALCVVLSASVGVVGSSLQDLSYTEERQSAFLESVERKKLSPRYWQQGYIGVRDSSVVERARPDR